MFIKKNRKVELEQNTPLIYCVPLAEVKLEVKNFKCKNFIKGDQLSTSIATASIIAKVHRDKYMAKIGKQFPYFRWEVNAGYGTKTHLIELHKRGISPHHRKSFKPIKDLSIIINHLVDK